jgi:hypothetical protein
VGYDADKKVKGRKIHTLVDIEGLPMRVVVQFLTLLTRARTAQPWHQSGPPEGDQSRRQTPTRRDSALAPMQRDETTSLRLD